MISRTNTASVRDVIIIGAGPAGLTAACYLGRFRRPTLIIENGSSRARWIPKSHNTPGFPSGVGGGELLGRLRQQALRYGATIMKGTVDAIDLDEKLVVKMGSGYFSSRFVVLATGVRDQLPPIEGAERAVCEGSLKICPICDAYEMVDRRIGVLGEGDHAAQEAQFLRHFSSHVTLLHTADSLDAKLQEKLVSKGIRVERMRFEELSLREGRWKINHEGGSEVAFDTVYSALGCQPRNELASQLGAERDARGALKVSAHQETSVRGLYAAGDVVRGLNQIVVAAAEGAIAAAHIHNTLRCGQAQ